jgi:hypothetical protein
MAVGVDDLLPGEDPVGDHKVLDQGIGIAHCVHPRLSLDGSEAATPRRRA